MSAQSERNGDSEIVELSVAQMRELLAKCLVRAGYKQTESGVVPQQWAVRRIADFASVGSGGTPSRAIAACWSGSIPLITTSQIDFGTIVQAEQFITEEGLKNSAAKLLPAGTLLIALYGQGKTRGKVWVLGIAAATNQACASISLEDDTSSEYVRHYLTSKYVEIRNSSNSGSLENLSGQIVKNLLVALPELEEQQAIAAALGDVDALLAGLDRLSGVVLDLPSAQEQTAIATILSDMDSELTALEARRDKTRALKQGMMQELLT